jgi:hypothetical protein
MESVINEVYSQLESESIRLKQPYIRTFTGINFTILNPEPSMIVIEDIAHALSRLCRYGGHCDGFYSVARHSLIMSYLADEEYAMEALLHDATEAYIGDCVTPLKKELAQFNKIEDELYEIIAKKYNLSYPMSQHVKKIDANMIGYEWEYFMEKRPNSEISDFYKEHFKESSIEDTKEEFINRYKTLLPSVLK